MSLKKLKRPLGRFSRFPVIVFRSIPHRNGRVSPDINTPCVASKVPVCADKVSIDACSDCASFLTSFIMIFSALCPRFSIVKTNINAGESHAYSAPSE